MPDYSNEATRTTEARLGPFVYDNDEEFEHADIIDRGPCVLDNGAIY